MKATADHLGIGEASVRAALAEYAVVVDEALLDRCAPETRSLLANSVGDFSGLSRRWVAEGRRHAGR